MTGSQRLIGAQSLVPRNGLATISHHSAEDCQHGTVSHHLPVIHGLAFADGRKELIVLRLIRIVLFTRVFPVRFSGDAF